MVSATGRTIDPLFQLPPLCSLSLLLALKLACCDAALRYLCICRYRACQQEGEQAGAAELVPQRCEECVVDGVHV